MAGSARTESEKLTARDFTYDPPTGDPRIIFEDDALILIDKPSGLLSVPGKAETHQDCLELRLRALRPETLLIHRLDMATSGIMVFAKTAHAQRHLGLQFEKRQMRKSYIAVVDGNVSGGSGHINMPLITDWPNRPRQMVDFGRGKPAQTDWVKLSEGASSTRLSLHPRTGRSHQLRLHLLSIGHPILGDRLYASDTAFKAAERLLLHASTLEFRHPDGGAWVKFEAPCPF